MYKTPNSLLPCYRSSYFLFSMQNLVKKKSRYFTQIIKSTKFSNWCWKKNSTQITIFPICLYYTSGFRWWSIHHYYFNSILHAYPENSYLFTAELWILGDAFSRAFFWKREASDWFVVGLVLTHFVFSVLAESWVVASRLILLGVAFLPRIDDLGRVKGICRTVVLKL